MKHRRSKPQSRNEKDSGMNLVGAGRGGAGHKWI